MRVKIEKVGNDRFGDGLKVEKEIIGYNSCFYIFESYWGEEEIVIIYFIFMN